MSKFSKTHIFFQSNVAFLARALIANPSLAMSAAEELGVKIVWAGQFERGRKL